MRRALTLAAKISGSFPVSKRIVLPACSTNAEKPQSCFREPGLPKASYKIVTLSLAWAKPRSATHESIQKQIVLIAFLHSNCWCTKNTATMRMEQATCGANIGVSHYVAFQENGNKSPFSDRETTASKTRRRETSRTVAWLESDCFLSQP